MTTELATDGAGDWQPTGASGFGGGVTHQFSSASGSYSFDFDGGSVDGEFFDSRNDGLAYGYEMTSTYENGQWNDTGSGSATQSGDTSSWYSDTGTLVSAGDGWTSTGSFTDGRNDGAGWSYAVELEMDAAGEWQATGGSGASSGLGDTDWLYQGGGFYSYPVSGGMIEGTFEHSNDSNSTYGFSTSATYSGGQWAETGTASSVDAGGGSSQYDAVSTVYPSGDGWSATVVVSEGGMDSYL